MQDTFDEELAQCRIYARTFEGRVRVTISRR